jgi:ABC-type nitrate/sulfonate/bicarbonate transport system substrate-binding protein
VLLTLWLGCAEAPAPEPAAPASAPASTPASAPPASISPESVAFLKEKGWWPLQIGYFADVPGFSAHWAVMCADRLLQARGIEANCQSFNSGPPILEAFLSGQTQLTHYGDFPFWNTVDKGVGAVAFAVTGVNNEVALVVPPDSPFRSLDDLRAADRELVIGTTLGSYAEFYLASIPGLKYRIAGMSMRDAQIVPAGVDAVAVWDPHLSLTLERGLGRKLDTVYPWYVPTAFEFVRRELHQHAPDVVQAIADASLEALLAVRADPERAARLYVADPRARGWTEAQARVQIDRYLLLYKPTYKYLHADFWAAEDVRVVASQFAAGRLTRNRTAEELKTDFVPEYMARSLAARGWATPASPVFLPEGWTGVVGSPPYPPTLNPSTLTAPQPFPEPGDLARP